MSDAPTSCGRSLRATVARCLLAAALLLPPVAGAATAVKIASAFDPQTMDPHAIALLYHSRIVNQVYEALINRDEQFRLEPGLATAWRAAPDARSWRLTLRQGVRFHDGTAFTAADAVFSLRRALQPTSQRAFQLKGVTAIRGVDASTVELQLEAPDAVLPEKLVLIGMMSEAWAKQHRVELPQDFNAKQETHAVRNANGTGPFRLERYEPDTRTLLQRHPGWWGWADPRSTGNADTVEWLTIRSDATRLAALISGAADVVLDPPIPDVARLRGEPQLAVVQGPDLGQQYLAVDQWHDELDGSDVKGRNPFKDIRVRRAVYHAVNVELIVEKVLRGLGEPTGGHLSPRLDGVPPPPARLPHDPARARALLAEAGYPNGFSVTLDCVNVAWREATCQAMTVMLRQVGIRATLRSSQSNQFFPRLSQGLLSIGEFGWTPSSDAWASLNALFRSWGKEGFGTFNAGRYANPRLDAVIDGLRVEPDIGRRRAQVAEALRLVADDIAMVPLYRRTLTWVTQKKVTLVQWPNDTLELRWLRVRG